MVRATPRTLLAVAVLAGALVGVGATMAFVGPSSPGVDGPIGEDGGLDEIAQFDSQADFQAYVDRGRQLHAYTTTAQLSGGGDGAVSTDAPDAVRSAPADVTQVSAEASAGGPDRIGETIVQVEALDEPDRVKTDGTAFYYAPRGIHLVHEPRSGDSAPPKRQGRTHVIDASDPADPEAIANIDDSGRMLQTGDRLVVFGHESITGYDISDPAAPEEVWSRPLQDRMVTARERGGTVYLVTRSPVSDAPCPIRPMGDAVTISCDQVYHPRAQIDARVTYTAFALEATSGEVQDSVSFVGTGYSDVVYMSTDGLYVTYTKTTDRTRLIGDFLVEEFERTPDHVKERIEEVRSYDLSPEATTVEIRNTVQAWLSSLNEAERKAIREDLRTEFEAYLADKQRDLQRTGIVRVGVDDADLSVDATGTVPGRPLNQFSLSQGEDSLRIATTVPAAGDAESVSDLYTLDPTSLERLGSETGMGEGQRIYAVRYVEETAYLVTFRQIDPLHVVDLSDPADPTEVGTLELPGFSNYLHPIDDDHVLGVGEEDGQVKAVLFDVSDPTDPVVADDLKLAAGWSEVSRTHHAFTIDRKHGVFFLPAGGSGEVIDYTNGTLERVHTVTTDGAAERARYVDDYLYVFAGSEVAVVDETDWTRETTLDLADS